MDRSVDPAGIAPYKFHLIENCRRNFGGLIERGGQEKLFPDRLHDENTGETGPGSAWDDDSGIGKITGIDPGADDSKYGGPLLYCGTGTLVSTWNGVTQRELSATLSFGAGENALPIPTFDEANGFLFGYRTVYKADGITPLYYVVSQMAQVGGIFGVTPLFATPALTGWGGSVPNAGVPKRIAWSVPESRYYTITDYGLVLSFAEGDDLVKEADHSLDTAATYTVYGVPVIFELNDEVVYLLGYGTGIAEPTVMAAPLCYYKDTNSGVWTHNTTLADKFVPTTKPILYDSDVYVGGYTQPTNSNDIKTSAVYVWSGSGTGWVAVATFAAQAGSQVRALAVLGDYLYALYDDPVNSHCGILDRLYGPTGTINQNYKVFFSQIPSVSLSDPQDGLATFRGELYTRIFESDAPFVGDGLLWRTNVRDVSGTWVLAGEAAPGQELNGAPAFVV
jgi:hypothetical protein